MSVHHRVSTSIVLLVICSLCTFPSFAIDGGNYRQNSAFKRNNHCTTERHIHLSTAKDSSSSITISFSSYPCDSMNQEHKDGIQKGDTLYRYHDVEAESNHKKTSSGEDSQNVQMLRGAVMIGTDPAQLNMMKGDKPTRYNSTIYHKNKDPEPYFSEYQHHITVNHLQPDTIYFYKCVVIVGASEIEDDEKEEHNESKEEKRKLRGEISSHGQGNFKILPVSEIFQFKTAPTPSSVSQAKIAIIGDLGTFSHSKETLSALAKMVDLNSIVLVGDISYANGDHRIWDEWFDMMDSFRILTRMPLYVAAGNHDAEGDLKTGELFTAYELRFKMPQIAPAIIGKVTKNQDVDLNRMYRLPYDYGNSFYAFKLGPSYNIVLNSFADFQPGSNQYKFLVKELKGINRRETPWVTVITHCPIYNTFTFHRHDPQPLQMKKILEPLYVKYRVNFVLSGHLHAYMRTKNVIGGDLNPLGPIHIIIGNGGRQANAPYYSEEAESWVAIRDHTTYGFGTIEYLNETTARYEWIQTGHNTLDDKGDNFLNPAMNLTDAMFVTNQYFL